MDKKPTIKTIAQLAGVSHVAVSRALRGCSDISAETTKRIRKIAEEVGYSPNANARNLSSKRSSSIGMIVPSLDETSAYNALFNQISVSAAKRNYCVMLGSSHRNVQLEEQHCRMMVENGVGALIVSPCTSDVSHIKNICYGHVPVLYVGGKTDPNETCALFCDYYYSAVQAVEYLYSLGHKNIAFFAYAPANLTIRQKEKGFTDCMKTHNLKPRVYLCGDASNTIEAGIDITKKLILRKELPTAIWCASDLMAVGVIQTLRKNGFLVPEDVSVMGHDDLYFDIFPGICLTTLHTPFSEIGTAAADLAIDLTEKKATEDSLRQVFRTSLVERNTVAPPKNYNS
ncbi:MAG: LacI family DNA-binding transcriptional regulator [Lachnospiraceae bacterium]|nr:LacI family DNA-binding transcriptional regulator [Lachnospiraceae bacterium]